MRLVYYYRLLYCSFCIYILCGMYFYVTMVYIVPYTDLTVFPVTNSPSYVRTTVTTSTMYMTTTSLLLSTIMSTSIFTILFSQVVTTLYTISIVFYTLSLSLLYILYSITTIVTSSQMTTFGRSKRNLGMLLPGNLWNKIPSVIRKMILVLQQEKDSDY